MPASQIRCDLDLIYPPMVGPYLNALAAAKARGAVYFATYGFRSYAESDALFAQGRTVMNPRGPTPGHPLGAKVTNAKGGQCSHNFGIGIDGTHDSDTNADDGLQPDWKQENYLVLKEELERVGLVSGGSFVHLQDWPHGQLAGFVTAEELAPLDRIFRATPGDLKTKLRAVWDHLDSIGAAASLGQPIASAPIPNPEPIDGQTLANGAEAPTTGGVC
jgi:hypothetical protein